MKTNPLKKFTNKQLLAEINRIAVFNKNKLGKYSSTYRFKMKDFKGKNTSEELNKRFLCMIVTKNHWLTHFFIKKDIKAWKTRK